jgi:hypothetical protein
MLSSLISSILEELLNSTYTFFTVFLAFVCLAGGDCSVLLLNLLCIIYGVIGFLKVEIGLLNLSNGIFSIGTALFLNFIMFW